MMPDLSIEGVRGEDREAAIVADTLVEFGQLQLMRNTFASHWEEAAELVAPNYRNTFYFGNFEWPGVKKTDRQIDASAMLALHRFAAICDSMLTPRNMFWHGLEGLDENLRKNRSVQLYFEQTTKLLFKMRYAPMANFAGQNQNAFHSLGAFGTQGMFVDQAVDPATGLPIRGIRYKNVPLGELFLRENHQGMVDGVTRWFRLTPEQLVKVPGWREKIPEDVWERVKQHAQAPIDILHRVVPRADFEPFRLDARGKRYASYYVCIQGKCLLQEGGYRRFPYAVSRYEQTPYDGPYGRGPIMQVLPSIKTLNAQKRIFLKQGHRAADPVLLIQDDGLMDIDLTPGAQNRGGWSADGKPLVGTLPTGNVQLTIEMMEKEQGIINDANMVSLFQILTESPQMTATEVIERTNEKGILLAPTIGRQQSEYLGPLIDRELDLLNDMGMLPPMPPILREARGYQVSYSSPLARAQRAQEVAGALRTLESVKELVAITQDPSLLDPFSFDRMIPDIAMIQATPASWMATDGEISDKRKQRAAAQQRQEAIQAAPAQAAMLKAQATVAKAGGVNLPNAGGAPPPGQQPPQQGGPQP
ncbi:Head-to-tail connector protein, podovirus-type [uncultured Caudovirales phage]|uniref:Head-to-tail connector protein, podovirus-type n=1 Tax=uncultured Caudovirales phage TaxID=2100421 RepID=A0A6J5LGA6_9CAUD|nr:Head-to-tail connector protein, podovirus-type [uncultured Caudovirales phage]